MSGLKTGGATVCYIQSWRAFTKAERARENNVLYSYAVIVLSPATSTERHIIRFFYMGLNVISVILRFAGSLIIGRGYSYRIL